MAKGVGALFMAEDLEGEVGDDLVRIHVRRGAGPALDHVDDEVLVPLSGENTVAGPADRGGNVRIEHAEFGIGLGGGFLDVSEGVDEVLEMREPDPGEGEILDRPRRLDAVVVGVRDLAFAERIVLEPETGDGRPLEA